MPIDTEFETVYPFKNGRALVKYGRGWCYIDSKGIKVTFSYNRLGEFSEGLANVQIGTKPRIVRSGYDRTCFGLMDISGKTLCSPRYSGIRTQSNGEHFTFICGNYLYVSCALEMFKVDALGERIELGEGIIEGRNNGMYKIETKEGYLYYDGNFEKANEEIYNAKTFSEGLAVSSLNGLYGYVNRDGVFVIQPKFKRASEFYMGLAYVQLDDDCGYINKEGEFIVNGLDEKSGCKAFADGHAIVKIAGKHGVIDRTGKFLIAAKYTTCEHKGGDVFLCLK